MALIVETGTGDATADSLVSLAEARAFAVSRGKVLPENDAAAEALVRNAQDYFNHFEPQMKGCRTTAIQALPFPRSYVDLYGTPLDKSTIPTQAKNAVCQICIEALNGDLQPAGDGRVVSSESVGPLKTDYTVMGTQPSFPKVLAFMAPLLNSGGLFLSTVRV